MSPVKASRGRSLAHCSRSWSSSSRGRRLRHPALPAPRPRRRRPRNRPTSGPRETPRPPPVPVCVRPPAPRWPRDRMTLSPSAPENGAFSVSDGLPAGDSGPDAGKCDLCLPWLPWDAGLGGNRGAAGGSWPPCGRSWTRYGGECQSREHPRHIVPFPDHRLTITSTYRSRPSKSEGAGASSPLGSRVCGGGILSPRSCDGSSAG